MSDPDTVEAASGVCAHCGQPVAPADQFCESCGTPLVASPVIPAGSPDPVGAAATTTTAPVPVAPPRRCTCGGEIDADGFCTTCGLRALSERDHFSEQPVPDVAVVCDKGVVHPRNEDAAAVAASEHRMVLVVCDGVTTATDSDVASLAAARAARDVLAAAPDASSAAPAVVVEHWTAQLSLATAAAQEAAAAADHTVDPTANPASTTYVAAVVDGSVLVTAWVGDSRCYWLPDTGATFQVSTDDSWASTQIANGTPREVAEADTRAHAITRWLGVDSPGGEPSTASVALAAPGWVLVCSDGLWNYCSPADELRALLAVQVAAVGADPLAVASALCTWANEQGGHDNVTVALARQVGATSPAPEPSPPPPLETPEPDPPGEQHPAPTRSN